MTRLKRLPGDLRSVARRVIRALADDPRPLRAKELESHPGYYRLWLPRDHRLVSQVFDDEEVVELLYIGPKTPELYGELGLGRQPDEPV
jgi:mRNA-degrading endonuclease RelE of RelBE toxin-antitoxin system